VCGEDENEVVKLLVSISLLTNKVEKKIKKFAHNYARRISVLRSTLRKINSKLLWVRQVTQVCTFSLSVNAIPIDWDIKTSSGTLYCGELRRIGGHVVSWRHLLRLVTIKLSFIISCSTDQFGFRLSGTPPFYGETIKELTDKIVAAEFDFDDALWDSVSEAGFEFCT